MLASEMLRVAVFLAVVGTVFVLAAVFIAQRIRGRKARAGLAAWFERAIPALAALGLGCIAYGYFVEPYWLEVTHLRIETPKLARGSRLVRIVLISDLHSDPKARLEERLPDVVAGLAPDVILFAGDSINSTGGLPNFRGCLKRLAALAPTFVVKGNWDVSFWNDQPLFTDTGARELDGNAVRLPVAGGELWIAGAAYGNVDGIERELASRPREAFTILLFHTPDEIYEVARQGVDLYCAGHTHGGQVALPLYGALVTLSRFDKKFEAGPHRVEQTWLYVNRGMGMEGGPAPRVRFAARPEVTLIELSGTR